MGSPLWGKFSYPSGVLQPTGGVVENCAILNEADDFYMHDVGCEESHSVICEDPCELSSSSESLSKCLIPVSLISQYFLS